jgi:ferric-dicitrate binding protein FerR (iron transport regulator)
MNNKKDKTNGFADEWMIDGIFEEESSCEKFHNLFKQMDVSSNISTMSEEMRESVLNQVNQRIHRAVCRSLWIRASLIAASVVLLLCTTNYVSYQHGYRQLSSQIVRLESPLGVKSSIVLSDGTKIMLNAGTLLTYPPVFTGKNREVEIEGEAFFEVTPKASQPFIVKAGNIRIQVLGTKFNLKAYEEEKNIEVTLEEGSVEIRLENQEDCLQIKPNQQILFDKTSQTFSKKQVNTNHYTIWKEGGFYFNRMTFDDISRQLERHFNVHININSEQLKQVVYSGDFVHKESLEQILKVMITDGRMAYKIEGNQIDIYSN